MDAPEISVYGEAKGEYTRQLCVFLTPCLESYFLELLDDAKKQSPSSSRNLWQFQNLLQAIPDWNQDKVIRETERIQKDCKCDYLEELLTAVFIAHTKVLSAIRLTTKQKKLQITIPKIDHFLHRVLADCARTIWTNAYLFAETNSIEKQKNLRQVSSLIQEAILQAIRGLLPVKSILREYLHEDDDEEEGKVQEEKAQEEEEKVQEAEAEADQVETKVQEETEAEAKVQEEAEVKAELQVKAQEEAEEAKAEQQEVLPVVDISANAVVVSEQPQQPMIYIDTKPSVTFSQEHIMFDSNRLDANEIHDLPFAEAELRNDEEDDEDDEAASLIITGDSIPMNSEDAEEILS